MNFVLLAGVALVVIALFSKYSWVFLLLASAAFAFYFGIDQDNLMTLLLFLIGTGLILVEFYVPDFGLAGLLGAGASLLALWFKIGEIRPVMLLVLASLVLIVVLAGLLLKLGFSLSISPNFVLNKAIDEKASSDGREDLQDIVGQRGQVLADLRPVGKIRVNGRTYDAYSQDQMLVAGSEILVTEVVRNKIYVRSVEDE